LQLSSIKPDDNISELLKTDLNKGFRLVVEKYSSRLYWHIRRLVILHEDADDALQNTFINAWRSIGDFRSESSLYTWLYTISTNEALALINKRKILADLQRISETEKFNTAGKGYTYKKL
jgi:RNA polymerase sigma-70 factor, ECF subfamily